MGMSRAAGHLPDQGLCQFLDPRRCAGRGRKLGNHCWHLHGSRMGEGCAETEACTAAHTDMLPLYKDEQPSTLPLQMWSLLLFQKLLFFFHLNY